MNAITREAIRQHKQAFEQQKAQLRCWSALRLTVGYCATVAFVMVLLVASVVLIQPATYPPSVLKYASAALFADVFALIFAVWRIVLYPLPQAALTPTLPTNVELADHGSTQAGSSCD